MSQPLQLLSGKPRSLLNGDYVREDLRLLEVDPAILEEIVSQGVIIKGRDGDEAVLCTSSKTYALKYVETTNTQLLVSPEEALDLDGSTGDENEPVNIQLSAPGLQTQIRKFQSATATLPPVVVCATTKAHIEMVEISPKLEHLQFLLGQLPYGLEEEEGDEDMTEAGAPLGQKHLFTFQELLCTIQASEGELHAALRDMHAVELHGHWRLVDQGYMDSLLELVILTAQQEGMPLSRISLPAVASSLSSEGYLPQLVRHCLTVYGGPAASESSTAAGTTPASGSSRGLEACSSGQDPDQGHECWALDTTKVCVHFAHKLLRGRPLPPQDFQNQWQEAVPSCMAPDMAMLRGHVLVDGKGSEARIKLFPAHHLSKDPAQRFAALFHERVRWDWSDLEPFLESLKVPNQTAGDLLLKYARASQPTPNDPVSYSAKNQNWG